VTAGFGATAAAGNVSAETRCDSQHCCWGSEPRATSDPASAETRRDSRHCC
jgi:hypothetical protein